FYRYLVDTALPRAGVLTQRRTKQDILASNPHPGFAGRVTSKHGPDSAESNAHEFPAANTARNSASRASNDASDAVGAFDSVFVSSQQPSRVAVLAAIVRLADVSGERLVRGTSLDSQPAITVADQFKVIELNMSDRSGWAEVEVKQAASIQYGFADTRPSTSRWRATLRRK